MLTKQWKLRERADNNKLKLLADSLKISDSMANLLLARGITTYQAAKTFFKPSLDDLHNPYLMDGMEQASLRVIKAITGNEKIYIYGDYDVDGTCSAALLYLFIKELGGNAEIYIPNRLTEGYGLSKAGIDYIKSKEASVIITVDCGITAVEETVHARSLGMEMIICDHHQPGSSIPDAFAVLDPLKQNCNYPFKYLSCAGVAFKLIQAICERIGKRDLPYNYLDLVAIAGAADIVPLIGENRILVKKGLELVNTNPRLGIEALIKVAGMQPGNLTAGHVVFTIAPRINAVGRMGDAIRAVDLFLTEDKFEAVKLAEVLEGENYQRRKIDELTYSHAISIVEDSLNLDDDIAIVLHEENWHPGVIGIVASRLVEKYYRPTVMLTTVDGVAKGSARSISGFNIYEALKQCEDLLLQFGGHEAAAGLALELTKVQEFKEKFNQIVKNTVTQGDVKPELLIDDKISLNDINAKFIKILDEFAPFGPGNMRPVFMAENVGLVYAPRIVGANHIVASIRQNGNNKVFDTIGFNLGSFASQIDKNKNLLDIAFTVEKSDRDGRTFPQLRLRDIKIKTLEEISNKELKLNFNKGE